MHRYDLTGKCVFLTGAARGIGADAARRLVEAGAGVALVDRDAGALEQRASELGPAAAAFPADVTDVDGLERAARGASERFGRIDVTIANAGISGPTVTAAAMRPGDFERVVDTNLLGAWRSVRSTLPAVVAARGYVLAISSMTALLPAPLLAAYTASKAGLEGFARSLRIELAHTGTRVGIGYFNFVDTEMVRAGLGDPRGAEAVRALPPPLRRTVPVAAAGRAILRGVGRRSARVYAPGWVPALIAARGLAGPFDALAGRHPRVRRACALDSAPK